MPVPMAPPPLLSAAPSRRRLLALLGVGGALLAGGGWLYRALGRFGPAAEGFQVFDADELPVVDALCEAFFPGPPEVPFTAKALGLSRFVDAYVGGLYEDTRSLFRLLIHGFDAAAVATHGARFHRLPLDERRAVLEAWRTSSVRTRSAAYDALSFPVKMGYFEDDRVRAWAGFTAGCDLSAHPGPKSIVEPT